MSALPLAPRRIAADHPAFDGHFPGRPVLPGALLLAELFEALQAAPDALARLGARSCIATAKFRAPVGPGATLAIALADAPGGLRFEIRRDDGTLVADGQLVREDA